MALGDNKAFFNETTFYLGDEQTGTTAISGISASEIDGTADNSGLVAKVLFTQKPNIVGETQLIREFVDQDRNLRYHVKMGKDLL